MTWHMQLNNEIGIVNYVMIQTTIIPTKMFVLSKTTFDLKNATSWFIQNDMKPN